MKKIVIICLLIGFSSCTSQEKKQIAFVDIHVEEFQKAIKKNDIQLVDVRTPKEFKQGHIKNAQLINFFDANFKSNFKNKLDKNRAVYLYCRSGGRSAKAAKMFKEAGFRKVYNLLGGFNAWSKSEQEIEK